MVQEDPDAAVVVNVTIGDDDVAVPACQVDAVQRFADRQLGQNGCHCAGDLHAARLLIRTNDLQPAHNGHALVLPDVLFHRFRRGRPFVRSD